MKNYPYIAANRGFQAGLNIGARALRFPMAKPVTGAGCRKEIPGILKKLGVTKVLMVTGRHTGATLAPPVIEDIRANGIKVVHYSEVRANPTTDTVYAIRDLYIREDCNGFIGLGGGSPIDAAKAAACLCARPGKTCGDLAGLLKVLKPIPKFIAVPTTAGTGSETTMASVITDSETHHKYAIMDPVSIPLYAVMDPELTEDLPAKTTATTGMDALTHALESYLCWTNQTKVSNEFAVEATVLIFKYLERAYRDPHDIEAREKMMEAAYKAGWSFGRAGVGNVHAIAHTLGGLYNTPHGLANAVILPIVLEDYGEKVYDKLAHLALLTGVCCTGTKEERAKAFIAEIYAMNERMDIPKGLEIKESDMPQMIKWAKAEANPTYPVPVVYDSKRFRKVMERINSQA